MKLRHSPKQRIGKTSGINSCLSSVVKYINIVSDFLVTTREHVNSFLLTQRRKVSQKILSTDNTRTHRFFFHTVALSLELLRSFARRTHRAVSDAFANTAPAVVAKLATNSVGSNTLA